MAASYSVGFPAYVEHVRSLLACSDYYAHDVDRMDDIENDTMLMDVGIDSLSMLDFHAKVARDFPGVAWSPTMLFDYPTLKELCEFMDEAMREAFNARLAKSLKR